MALSTVPRNALHGTWTLADGTGSPLSLIVPYTGGDLQLSGLAETLNEAIPVEDGRGHFMGLVFGGRTYPTFSFTGKVTELTAATGGSLADFILRNGAYSAGVSTQGAGASRPWTFTLTVAYEGTNFGDSADGSIVLTQCYATLDFAEAKEGNTFSITGTVYGPITGDMACAQVA